MKASFIPQADLDIRRQTTVASVGRRLEEYLIEKGMNDVKIDRNNLISFIRNGRLKKNDGTWTKLDGRDVISINAKAETDVVKLQTSAVLGQQPRLFTTQAL